ncbi:MAG: hypothetical protein IJG60_01230 [Thermoguttaceae bacterium]|nr:hypothetical protein [Thermoguttaceae bacterium]
MSRKPKEPTRLVRIPVSLIPQVKKFVAQGGVGCPFYESAVPGGFPSSIQDENTQTVNIISYLIPHPEKTVLIKVTDDSFEHEGFFRDDILVSERGETPQDGDLVICNANGNIFLNRLDLSAGRGNLGFEICAVVRFRIHTLYGDSFFN